ncbi:MAG: GNAT family N-acetyltransferase [bacterium]|nr:GNAT family N-acetyltransferase [bacterium]
MKHKLKDGRIVDIVPLSAKVPAKWLLDYINGVIEEDGYLQYDKPFNMNQQKEWIKNTLLGIQKGEQLYFAAVSGKRVIGSCSARREVGRGRDNVVVGIVVSKDFRGVGLGEFLMEKTIDAAKKNFKPNNIYLYVAGANKIAKKLYEKIGFVEFVRYPDWWIHKGKKIDSVGMLLKK